MRRTKCVGLGVVLGFVAMFAGVAILAIGCRRSATPPEPSQEKKLYLTGANAAGLNQINLPDLQDVVKPLSSYMGKKGMLLVFADISCPYTGQALGDLPKVSPKLAGLGVPTVVINIGDPRDGVMKTYASRKTGTPVLYDVTDSMQKRWSVTSVPTVVLLGPDGNVTYHGNAVWSTLATAVETAQGLSHGSLTFDAQGTEFG